MGNTVTIRPSNWTIAPQGAATPQANLPGTYSMDAARSGVYGHLADSLGQLAGIELRQREARRADALAAAKVGFLKDTMTFVDGLNEDQDFGTQRERTKAFQDEAYNKWAATLGDDESRQMFQTEMTIPALRQEFEVGRAAAARLNDQLVANYNHRTEELLAQTGFDPQRDADALQLLADEGNRLYKSGVISAVALEDRLSKAKHLVTVNTWSVRVKNDPAGTFAALLPALGGKFRDLDHLAYAVEQIESGGNHNAVSSKGAFGAMQLMPGTAKDLGQKYGIDTSTPEGNRQAGKLYLKEQLEEFGDVRLAGAAYNWGPGHLKNWLKTGRGLPTADHPNGTDIPQETIDYVRKLTGQDIRAFHPGSGQSPEPLGLGYNVASPTADAELGVEKLGGLSTPEALKFAGMAEAELKARQTELNGLIQAEKNKIDDHLAFALETGDFGPVKETESKLATLGDAEAAAALGEQRNIYEQVQPVLQGYSSEPLLAQTAKVQEIFAAHLRPDNAKTVLGIQQKVESHMASRVEAFKTDPAGFVANHPGVRTGPTVQDQVARSIEQQARLGEGLNFAPQVLGKEQAASIRNAYDQAPTVDKYKMLQGMKTEYGQYFYDAAREAALPSVAVALGGGMGSLPEATMQKLLAASSIPENEIPKQMEKADAEAQVANSKVMQVLQATAALLAGDEGQARAVGQVQNTFTKAVLMGVNLDDVDNQYSTVLDSGFCLAVPKNQGDINDIIYGLDYRRAEVAKDMTKDAVTYADMLASRERILSGVETVWVMDGEQFLLMDTQTQSVVLDRFGRQVSTNMGSIPEMAAEGRQLADLARKEALRRHRRVF